jgi:hypothetical protein
MAGEVTLHSEPAGEISCNGSFPTVQVLFFRIGSEIRIASEDLSPGALRLCKSGYGYEEKKQTAA